MLQESISFGSPVQTPFPISCSALTRVLCLDPPSQDFEHSVHSPHVDHVQSLAQFIKLQDSISIGSPEQTPAPISCSALTRVRPLDPSPQVLEHDVHSPHVDQVQSLAAI